MKYMLLVYLEEQALSEADREKCYLKSAQLTRELPVVAGQLHYVDHQA